MLPSPNVHLVHTNGIRAARRFPQKILIISDEHRAAKISNFPAYQANILALMAESDHVVEIGDNAELFFIKNDHAQEYAALLDVLAGKGRQHWEKELNTTRDDPYHKIKSVMQGELSFLREFAERFPHVKIHKVLGNHENVRKFRSGLDELQQQHPNFEWSPEAIRIGDGLFTHAHLQMGGKGDQKITPSRLREAKDQQKWRDLCRVMETAAHVCAGLFWYPERASRLVHAQLKLWDGRGDMSYMHEGETKPFNLEWVKHVFFGHTHHKFDNIQQEGIAYHNPGAVVEVTSGKPEDMGILQAELHEDGTIRNVRPATVFKDRHLAVAR